MFTWGYHVKIENGPKPDEEQRKNFASIMRSMSSMEFGPDMGTIPESRFAIESVDFEDGPDGHISGITVHANMPMSEEFHGTAGERIADLADQAWYEISRDESVDITAQGPMDVLGREGDVPSKLYHITDKEKSGKILKEGLIPEQGANSYRTDEDFIYLTDMEQLPIWMGILQEPEDIVLLEVDPAGVKGLDRGRTFDDREYADAFSEYRTREPVPAGYVKEAELSQEEQEKLYGRMQEFLKAADENRDEPEKAVRILDTMASVQGRQERKVHDMGMTDGSDDLADGFAEAVESIQEDGKAMTGHSRQRREDMVSERCRQLAGCSDMMLAEKAADYFRKNRTMPGEKAARNTAAAQLEAMQRHREHTDGSWEPDRPWSWNEGVPEEFQADRDAFARQMAEIAVKDVSLKGSSRPRPLGKSRPLDTLIAMRTPDSKEEGVHVHMFSCMVSGEGSGQGYRFENGTNDFWEHDAYCGQMPPGFVSNHPHMGGMECVVCISDYSMGRLGNLNVVLTVDLMQEVGGLELELGDGGGGGTSGAVSFEDAVRSLSSGGGPFL